MKLMEKCKTWNKIWYLIAALVLMICLYAVGCYPLYTEQKTRTMKRLYREMKEMDLNDLDDDDLETLNEFQKEKFEVMIVNEKLDQIYTSKRAVPKDYINKQFGTRLDKYTEKAPVERRDLELRQVLILRGKVTQGDQIFYVYVKKDVQSGLDIIQGTVTYFSIALMLIVAGWYLCMKKEEKSRKKQSRQSEYQLLESQREFMANISHELKTPLAVVSSQVEMLEIAEDKIDRPYYYASIREELDKMSKMVGELLDFSMLDNQLSVMERSRVNVSEMLEYLMLRYDALFQKNGIKVEQKFVKDGYVYGNRMYLERAVNNYLMNAFQHTQQGKGITVTLKRERQFLRLEVYNDGETIPEERMDHIWDSFYTSSRKKKPSAQDVGNIGLGLFVVRNIVENHEGSCGVENKECGVTFWIELPERKEP